MRSQRLVKLGAQTTEKQSAGQRLVREEEESESGAGYKVEGENVRTAKERESLRAPEKTPTGKEA